MSDKEIQLSDKEIQLDVPNHHAFEPLPYFEPSKELLEAYHQALKDAEKDAEFVKKECYNQHEKGLKSSFFILLLCVVVKSYRAAL